MRSRPGPGECTQGAKERFGVTGQEDQIPLSADGGLTPPLPDSVSLLSHGGKQ